MGEYLLGDSVLRASKEAGRRRRAEIMALRQQGMTLERIGSLIGCSKQRVGQLLAKARKDLLEPPRA